MTAFETALAAFGWEQVDESNTLSIWRRGDFQTAAPRNPEYLDYQRTMAESLAVVRNSLPSQWSEFRTAVEFPTFDQTRLRARPSSESHALPLAAARVAINGLWAALVAAVRSSRRKRPVLGSTGKSLVEMYAQTAQLLAPQQGSFVFAVIAETVVPGPGDPQIGGPPLALPRAVNDLLMGGAKGAVTGSASYLDSNRLDGLMEAVSQGLSVELARALIQIVGAVGTVELSHRPAVASPEWLRKPSQHTLTAEVTGPLEKFVRSLTTSPPRQATVVGTVSQLTDTAEGPFTVELKVIEGVPQPRVRFRGTTLEERATVSQAFRTRTAVSATGQLAIEGKTAWLYGSSISLAPAPPFLL